MRIFDPSLAVLRYRHVGRMLADHGVERFADMGCGDCRGMLDMLQLRSPVYWRGDVDKEPPRPARFTMAVGVDRVHQAVPRVADRGRAGNGYLPLHVSLWEADLTAPLPDLAAFLRENDVRAAVSVEVIEHMDAKAVPDYTRTLLGGECGFDLVIVTTPNRDANPLMGMAEGTMRHPDHKFEWSEEEFRAWAEAAAAEYDKEVAFSGIGYLGDELAAGSPTPETSPTPTARCRVPASSVAVFTSRDTVPLADMDGWDATALTTTCRVPACGGACAEGGVLTRCRRSPAASVPTPAPSAPPSPSSGKRSWSASQGSSDEEPSPRRLCSRSSPLHVLLPLHSTAREVEFEACPHSFMAQDLAYAAFRSIPPGEWVPVAALLQSTYAHRLRAVWECAPDLVAHLRTLPDAAAQDAFLASQISWLLAEGATEGLWVDSPQWPTAVKRARSCFFCGDSCTC